MRSSHLIIACVAVLCATSCAIPRIHAPAQQQVDPNAQIIYTQGVPALRSTVEQKDVAVDLTRPSGMSQWMDLNVFYRNLGEDDFTFEPGQVRVYGYNAAGMAKPLEVYTAERYIRWKTRRDIAIAVVAVAATVAVAASVDAPASNSGELARDDFWWWVATDIANTATNIAWMTSAMPAPYVAPDRLIRTHTLYTNEALGGIIKIRTEPNYDKKYLVEVPVGADYYAKFIFDGEMKRLR
jgi:hypothetical protein